MTPRSATLAQSHQERSAARVPEAPAPDAPPWRYSIEVMPRTADAIGDLTSLLPRGTEVYIAQIGDTAFADMLRTALRVRQQGFIPIPHILARAIADHATLEDMIGRYRQEAGVTGALVLAGSLDRAVGPYADADSVLRSDLFDRYGYTELRVAGHPEGSRAIDADGGARRAIAALQNKQASANRTEARLALVTQFAFNATPIRRWIRTIRQQGITMPVHIGLAGPASLPTLLKYAALCGIGPSIRSLRVRRHQMTQLLAPVAPDELHDQLQRWATAQPEWGIAGFHLFPMGGIRPAADWLGRARAQDRMRRSP